MFISPGDKVYEGMVVGENSRQGDIEVNVCKRKHATNIRAAGSDEALRLVPPKVLSLEQALEFIDDDELVEITPKSMRIRKAILDSGLRRIRKKSKFRETSSICNIYYLIVRISMKTASFCCKLHQYPT